VELQAEEARAVPFTVRFAVPRSWTPGHLIEKILGLRPEAEGEVLNVSVLYCQLSDGVGVTGDVQAAGLTAFLGRFLELVLSEVHSQDGVVDRVLEDGIVAFFGAPISRRDHAKRAALAALAIRRAIFERKDELDHPLGIETLARMGLNTGSILLRK